MAGAGSPAPNQPPDVEAGRSGLPGGHPAANGIVPRALETVGPPAFGGAADAADSKSEYAGADEAHKVEHEREVLPEDEKTAKPVGYFSLYRWVPADEHLCRRKPQHGAPRRWAAPSCADFSLSTHVLDWHPLELCQVCGPHRLAADGAGHSGRSRLGRRDAHLFHPLRRPVSLAGCHCRCHCCWCSSGPRLGPVLLSCT